MPQLKITLRRSPIGYERDQRATAEALGLRRLHQTVLRPDNPSIRGMVFKINHLLEVSEVTETAAGETQQ
jgi:large subunit ribosomal protein L30